MARRRLDVHTLAGGNGLWRKGAATRIHIAMVDSSSHIFPCIRKTAVLNEAGTGLTDVLDIASGLGRMFCGKCWARLSPVHVAAIEQALEGRATQS